MHKLKYLQIFGASKRGCVRHLRADFISPVPDWLFRFLPPPSSYRRYGGGLHGGLDEEYQILESETMSLGVDSSTKANKSVGIDWSTGCSSPG
jgi:hypothetical protein